MTEEINGRNGVAPQETMTSGFAFGSCTAEIYILSRTSQGWTGELENWCQRE